MQSYKQWLSIKIKIKLKNRENNKYSKIFFAKSLICCKCFKLYLKNNLNV